MSVAIVTFGENEYDIEVEFKDDDITGLSPKKIAMVNRVLLRAFKTRINEINAAGRQKVMDRRRAEDEAREAAEAKVRKAEEAELERRAKQLKGKNKSAPVEPTKVVPAAPAKGPEVVKANEPEAKTETVKTETTE